MEIQNEEVLLSVKKVHDNYFTMSPRCCLQNSGLEQYSLFFKLENVYLILQKKTQSFSEEFQFLEANEWDFCISLIITANNFADYVKKNL